MNEEMLTAIKDAVGTEVYAVWFLIATALVFWMQAGFAMVETGFTRAKNAGNIIMKNLMDFCIGTVMFIVIGFGLLLGEDIMGILGKPGLDVFTSYGNFDWPNFIFNLMFCATTATIVSGAMAERTKFLSYCVYSGVISAIIYPIEAHWVWGGGWLAQMGFHDFAGSTCIHMVGGICALIGAAILGPRIGKFEKDKDGRVTKVNAIPGHSLTLGALGVFILWLGWYGFNGAAATSAAELSSIFVTTTIAPAIATVVCMIFTWVKYGKPDVSMCLNASLAGLVGVTASCDVVDAAGAIAIGAVSGLLVIFGVWLLDYKLHIDDPVGAVAVHMLNGIWGTVAVGLFATDTAPAFARGYGDGVNFGANQICGKGLFYGGGFDLLGKQLLGMVAIMAFTAVMITITFFVIKAVIGLRASAEEETRGLDVTEHGLVSAYADFMPSPVPSVLTGKTVEEAATGEVTDITLAPSAAASEAGKYNLVSVICKQNKFEELKKALSDIGVTGVTVTQVLGCGVQKGAAEYYRGTPVEASLLPKIKVDVVVSKIPVETVVNTIRKSLYTGHIGDGKIFVYGVNEVVRVRTGEIGYDALQDAETE